MEEAFHVLQYQETACAPDPFYDTGLFYSLLVTPVNGDISGLTTFNSISLSLRCTDWTCAMCETVFTELHQDVCFDQASGYGIAVSLDTPACLGTYGLQKPPSNAVVLVDYDSTGCPDNDTRLQAFSTLPDGKCRVMTGLTQTVYFSISSSHKGYSGAFGCATPDCKQCATIFVNVAANVCSTYGDFKIFPSPKLKQCRGAQPVVAFSATSAVTGGGLLVTLVVGGLLVTVAAAVALIIKLKGRSRRGYTTLPLN